MINYYELGSNLQLNQIVFAGSHDAGITLGKDNVKTQEYGIYGQAKAGVRIFDIRITARSFSQGSGMTKGVELVSFHATDILQRVHENKIREISLAENQKSIANVTTVKLTAGVFGESLKQILLDARDFVHDYPNEFVILKFDHSKNWALIVETCTNILQDYIYKGIGNINTKTLENLKGKVITIFEEKGLVGLQRKHPPATGIFAFKNLYDKDNMKSYEPFYPGLQYIGKGGTAAIAKNEIVAYKWKIAENEKKQTKLMLAGRSYSGEVLGMMYWTTTGMTQSIKFRNDEMWESENQERLIKLWEKSRGLRGFFPNIVMIDFADENKCGVIHGLNYRLNHVRDSLLSSL